MKLFIFQYDEEFETTITHWALATSEEGARLQFRGFENYGLLAGSFKVVGEFTLADQQNPRKAKERGKAGQWAERCVAELEARSILVDGFKREDGSDPVVEIIRRHSKV